MWKHFVHDYLSYTNKERVGIFILLGLIIACLFIPFLYPYLYHQKEYNQSKFNNEIARLKLRKSDSSIDKKYPAKNFEEDNYNDFAQPSEKNYPKIPAEVFSFDPNTATLREWKRLGVKDKTVENIQKYLSKGGHFYKPGDISKIWGLHSEDIKRLLPYVSIEQTTNDHVQNNLQVKPTSYIPKTIQPLDINMADTTGFIALPGIGSTLAQRIIKFRDKLGGFNSVDQVSETFGLPDSVFQKIKGKLISTNIPVKKININTAFLDDMKTHPYIRYNVANAIIVYRTQHGNFLSIIDLKKIMIITDDMYKKIEPYITIE
ncbi:MAG: helix-hairpin-helix domain-containing protein [Ginsengibacter sp.]